MRAGQRRSLAGWGYEGAGLDPAEIDAVSGLLAARFPQADLAPVARVTAIRLRAPRIAPPAALAAWCATDPRARALHALGRSYRDVVRAARGEFPHPPDVVATPLDAAGVTAVIEWCAQAGAACVPVGGGTSVVGGIEARDVETPVVALSTAALDQVLGIDRTSRAAHVQAGILGPALEDQLRPHGLTLRFFPQSFEHSTLGGWIATRAGGHYATRLTHIDDLVESVTAVTPAGLWSSRRLPGSGAGPSPDRLLLGSEGILGVITEAWVRLQDRPVHRAGGAVRFPSFAAGATAVRALVQSGFDPANCRLLDPVEAAINGAGDGTHALLILGFESAHQPVAAAAAAATALCLDHGGTAVEVARAAGGAGSDLTGTWRAAFVRAPYLRDALVSLGVLSETFETAITWDRLDALVAEVSAATEAAVRAVCGDGFVTCRLTHAYPDGAAPYFTVIAPARRGAEIAQWDEIKAVASEAILAAGGTITHHHAVGRDHRPWYDRQRPEPFAAALRAAKHAIDPAGILNPGVLLPR